MSPLTEESMKWIGVDLDDTLATNTGAPEHKLVGVIDGAREAMKDLDSRGYKIIIFTARPYSDYPMIEGWLTDNGIPFRRIVCGKPLLLLMIDDRNVEFRGDWGEASRRVDEKLDAMRHPLRNKS